jgi:hypothetical protein
MERHMGYQHSLLAELIGPAWLAGRQSGRMNEKDDPCEISDWSEVMKVDEK